MKYPEDFEIIFSGGPLLPPRRSKPPRWWTMGGAIATVEHDPKETERLREATRPRRAYNKTGKHGRVSPVQSGPAAPAGESEAQGDGVGGHSPESIPDLTNHTQGTVTE